MTKSDDASAGAKKTPTKKGELIRLLRAKAGADVAVLGDRLGWQPHTVRAATTGLRKAGHVVVATKTAGGGASRYRIMSGEGKANSGKQQPTAIEQPEASQTAEPTHADAAPDAR